MIRLHLVGFTTDLKNLIFARRKGAKTGAFVVSIDQRLRRTLEEVARLEGDSDVELADTDGLAVEGVRAKSKLSPKEIQHLLRRGKDPHEVARAADAEESWIERFYPPILAERAGVVDSVKAGVISKQRLGRSSASVGDAIFANLRERRVNLPPEVLEEGWDAILKDGEWEVSFSYLSRGQSKAASFAFDPVTREVRPLNALARELAWRAPEDEDADASTNSRPRPRRNSGPAAKKRSTRSGTKAKRPRRRTTRRRTTR